MSTTVTTQQAPLLYTSITSLPFARFQTCMCDKDLTALIISGTPTQQELNVAWEDILVQYSDALGGIKHTANIKLYREIRRLQIALQQATLLIGILKQCYVKKFADALNKVLNTSFKFNILDLESYDKELHKCEVRTRSFEIQITLKATELEALQKGDKKEGYTEPTREHFQELLIYLSDHAGRELDENTMTVFTFCERLRRYNKHMELLSKKGNNK